MSNRIERHVTGHLRWLKSGEVLASWILTTPLQRARNLSEAAVVAREHRELMRAFPGHRYWLESLLMWTDPSEIVAAMTAGVDLQENPAWAETTGHTLELLQDEGLGERRFILTVKLNLPKTIMLQVAALAVGNEALETMGMSPIAPSEKLASTVAAKALVIEQALPASFGPKRMTQSEIVWSRRHAWGRSGADLIDPVKAPDIAEELLARGGEGLGVIHLDPNEVSQATTTAQRLAAPMNSKYIVVRDDAGTVSYQAGIMYSSIPQELEWPDNEFLGRIDDTGIPVDLTITGVTRSNHEARRQTNTALKQLSDQNDQIDNPNVDPNLNAEHQQRVEHATALNRQYAKVLQDDQKLLEHEPLIIASVAANDAETVEAMARDFKNADVNRDFVLARPLGQEEHMFWLRQPGGVPSVELKSYRQYTHSATMGATSVVTTTKLGDDTGIPIAINEASSLRRLVYLEPFGLGRDFRQKSPSIATQGDQGGGKTMFAKTYAASLSDRGARVIATDTSDEAEWVTFANSLDTSVAVVDFGNPTCSIDPLRTLPAEMAGPVMQSFLSTLLDIDATGPQGRVLAKVLKPKYLTNHNIGSAGQLFSHLAAIKTTKDGVDKAIAAELADRVEVFTDLDADGSGVARVIFDPTLPPLDMSAQWQLWRMNTVQLPEAEELNTEHLYRAMSIAKRLGRSSYALYATFSHQVCFANRNEPALQSVDEFHHMTTSPEAMRVTREFLRYGRRSMAAWHAQSHLPEDFDTLLDLVRTRIVARVSDETAAQKSAAFLGKTPGQQTHDGEEIETSRNTQRLAEEILEHNSRGRGAAMLRDHRGTIGPVQLLRPASPERYAAADTATLQPEAV